MFDLKDPQQIAMFPELSKNTALPSIASQPQFETALANLIRISDLGAFVQLNINGIDKGYSLNVNELEIPPDFLKDNPSLTPLSVQLFPAPVRRQLQKLVYDIKAYFTAENSLHTTFGPFLYRHRFSHWNRFLELEKGRLIKTVKRLLGKKTYSRFFIDQFKAGYDMFQSAADITAPWEFRSKITMALIRDQRRRLEQKEFELNNLSPTDIDFPMKMMIIKTHHIPLKLDDYLKQINIISFFKTIHIEHLADVEINTLDDIRHLFSQF